ncbi:MAG: hypothetical protein KDD69_14725 [Bdellovibrionales bacterium]|nr:hypothetical protein [Bdellovibrionales bacterium]
MMKLKNITLSADEELIKTARRIAESQHTTLNALFREWLGQYRARDQAGASYARLMDQLSYANAGKHFSREELNER